MLDMMEHNARMRLRVHVCKLAQSHSFQMMRRALAVEPQMSMACGGELHLKFAMHQHNALVSGGCTIGDVRDIGYRLSPLGADWGLWAVLVQP